MAILFAQDWARFPQAIIDTRTKNESFLRLASVYRSMGIRNHAFILSLLNPALQGVDPHSPYLTQEQMLMIALECKLNPWYWIREVVRVPAIGGSKPTFFEANRGNIALYWLFYNHITQILIQPRQTGKSFSTDTLMILMLELVCLNTKINLLTKDDGLRRKNIIRLKEIMDDLPRYLDMRNRDDANNTEEITIKNLGNYYSTHVPQASPKKADNMGRGLTTSIIHIDEGPFQTNIAIALKAALPAMGAAADKSKAEGAPYGTIFTTTAGKKDDKDGSYIYKLLQEAAVWDEKFFDCQNLEALEKLIRRNSRTGVLRVACVFNHRQLGKTDEWLARKIEEATVDGDAANRDFFNMWTSGSQSHPLPIHVLEQIAASNQEIAYTEISSIGGYITRWYIPEEEIIPRLNRGHYILGMDTSEASGNDDISLVLYDAVTLDVLAAGTYNETNLITFASWVLTWFTRFKNVTGIIERRSTGSMLLDYLILKMVEAGIDPFRRLFNMIAHEYQDPANQERYEEICLPMHRRDPSIYTRYKKFFGYATSGSGTTSREALYSMALKMAANHAASKVHDKSLIDQILGLVIRNGRIDHEKGEHDDMVIGWLLCNWLIFHGVNLSFYGIDSKRLLSEVAPLELLDPKEALFIQEQNDYRDRIEELSERLSKERDDYLSLKLEQEIRSLVSKLVFEDNEVFSVDEMIRQAKEKRRNNVRERQFNHHQSSGYYNTSNPYGVRAISSSGFSGGFSGEVGGYRRY